MLVIESRRPLCWACKQLGHFAKTCPQKTPTTITTNNKNAKQATSTVPEPEDHLDNQEKEWTQVIRKKKKINHNRNNNNRNKPHQFNPHTNNPYPNMHVIPFSPTLLSLSHPLGCSPDHNQKIDSPPKKRFQSLS